MSPLTASKWLIICLHYSWNNSSILNFQNLEFWIFKFEISKLGIFNFQIWNFKIGNFEFSNLKFEISKLSCCSICSADKWSVTHWQSEKQHWFKYSLQKTRWDRNSNKCSGLKLLNNLILFAQLMNINFFIFDMFMLKS